MGRSAVRRHVPQGQRLRLSGHRTGVLGRSLRSRQGDADPTYCGAKRDLLENNDLQCFAISTHLVGQAVCDSIDARHKTILPPYVWGDGDPAGVNRRAAEEMKNAARARSSSASAW